MPLVRELARSRISALVVLILLCVFWAHALGVASATSMTVDEGLHIASGYTIWRTGDYRLIEEHPPLVKLWLALPLLAIPDLGDPTTLSAWEDAAQPTTESLPLLRMAQQLLYPYQPIARWLYPARAMSTLLGVLLLAVIARWSRECVGPLGSLLALALASFDPNLLAHAAVAGTDLGAAAFITLGLWRAAHFLQSPNRRTMVAAGVALGLALAAKLTAMLLGPALALAGLIRLVRLPPRRRRRLFLRALGVVLLSALTLWAVYGLQVGPLPGTSISVPAPAHSIPIRRLLAHSEDGHQAYLLGRNSMKGWWTYFPVAFLIKTPLPALLALCGGLVTGIRRGLRSGKDHLWMAVGSPAILFVGVYAVASMLSSLNIGYRHLLPILPVLYVAAAGAAPVATNPRNRTDIARSAAVAALVLGQMATTLAQTPHLLAFFNLAVGGADEGWRYLADSNTDWGQAYKSLAAYQESRGVGKVGLAAFVFYDPAIYGVDYYPLPPLGGDTPAIFPSRLAPPAGDYVISATPLDGIPTADDAMYDWFRWREPDAQIGDALFHYRVSDEETVTRWLAQCTTPAPPLDTVALEAGFGRTPDRVVTFDCSQSWLYPAGDQGPGAFVMHGALLNDSLSSRLHLTAPTGTTSFIEAHLAHSAITYWQRAYRDVPSFAVFRSEHPPQHIEGEPAGSESGTPVFLDGPLAFLGARLRQTDAELEIETWWRVTAQPDQRPFSIMGHLVSDDASATEVSDGLGLAHASLRPGDTLVQRHAFTTEQMQEKSVFQTGVYWLDTMGRWPILGITEAAVETGEDVISIPLDRIRE